MFVVQSGGGTEWVEEERHQSLKRAAKSRIRGTTNPPTAVTALIARERERRGGGKRTDGDVCLQRRMYLRLSDCGEIRHAAATPLGDIRPPLQSGAIPRCFPMLGYIGKEIA